MADQWERQSPPTVLGSRARVDDVMPTRSWSNRRNARQNGCSSFGGELAVQEVRPLGHFFLY